MGVSCWGTSGGFKKLIEGYDWWDWETREGVLLDILLAKNWSSVLVSGNTPNEIIGEFKYWFAILTVGEKILDIWFIA